MLLSNLHTHTTFSDGNHTIEENVLSAIEKGFDSIGISDHAYTSFDTSFCIQKENEEKYKSEIFSLREKYRGRIEIYYGYEFDMTEMAEYEDLDYGIYSLHYVKTPDGYKSVDESRESHTALLNTYFDGDTDRLAASYYEELSEKVSRVKPEILGHFDIITKYSIVNEESAVYRKAALEALSVCIENSEIVEINTGAIARGYRNVFYPAPCFLNELKAHGTRLILSSDSHKKDNLDSSFDFAREVLKSHGFQSAVALKGSKFEEYAL